MNIPEDVRALSAALTAGLLAASCGGGEEAQASQATEEAAAAPRPVAVVELGELDPSRSLLLTGSVQSWKEEDLAFEVGGRVEWIVEESTQLDGRWTRDGEVLVDGDPVARLDPELYGIARVEAEATLRVAEHELELARVELERVLPAGLRAAAASRDRAASEYGRIEAAAARDAVSAIDVIRSRAEREATAAAWERAQAAIEAKQAAVQALEARVESAREGLRRALYDLERCTLYAPFPGEVSGVLVEAGGHASAAQPVAHLVMMDPIEVVLRVSAATADELEVGQPVQLFLAGDGRPARGEIHRKATVADPLTHTFQVSLLTRNERVVGKLKPGDPLLAHPRVAELVPVEPLVAGDPESPLLVEESRALRHDGGGAFVWAAEGLVSGQRPDRARPLVSLRRVPVVPGSRRVNFQGLYVFRELADPGELTPDSLVAFDVPEGFRDGDEVLVAGEQWRLRPGQLVQVLLDASPPEPGLYLPLNAIRPVEAGRGVVFAVHEGSAREVPVRLLESAGELFRLEAERPADAPLLAAGCRVVTGPLHFLVDGEPVRPVRVLRNDEVAR